MAKILDLTSSLEKAATDEVIVPSVETAPQQLREFGLPSSFDNAVVENSEGTRIARSCDAVKNGTAVPLPD